MNAEDIKKAREIISKATPGPWATDCNGVLYKPGAVPFMTDLSTGKTIHKDIHESFIDDNLFISAAREGWPSALDEIEALRAIIADKDAFTNKLRAELSTMRQKQAKAWAEDTGELIALRAVADAADRLCRKFANIERKMIGEVTENNLHDLIMVIKAWRGE